MPEVGKTKQVQLSIKTNHASKIWSFNAFICKEFWSSTILLKPFCFFDSFDDEREACHHYWFRETGNRGIQKLTLHHSYLFKWKNSKNSEFLNISFTDAFWLRYNQMQVLLFSLQSFLSQRNHTWRSSFGNQQLKKLLVSL